MKIIAEIGLNFNGDIDLARQTIYAAKQAGADAVKFQNFRVETFINQRSENWTYVNCGMELTETQDAMFRRHEIDYGMLVQLQGYAEHFDIEFSATPMCIEGLRDLVRLEVPWLKNGSDMLQDLNLIREMAKTGIPTIISTGMAEEKEITDAVEMFYSTPEHGNLTLLHCVSAYPAPDEAMNICRIRSLRERYRCDVGLSDHSEGITAGILAAAYGATTIEKHFTLSKLLPGPDHAFSADPTEFSEMVTAVCRAEKQVGTPGIGMTEIELENRRKWFK